MPAIPIATELKEKALIRLLPPYNWSLRQVADEIGTSPATVCKWRKTLEEKGLLVTEQTPQSPESWTAERKFTVVLETAALSELALSEYCRGRGLYPEQIKAWKKVCIKLIKSLRIGQKGLMTKKFVKIKNGLKIWKKN